MMAGCQNTFSLHHIEWELNLLLCYIPESNVHRACMGSTWVLSSPGGPHVGPMNLAIWHAFMRPGLLPDSFMLTVIRPSSKVKMAISLLKAISTPLQ